MKRPEFIARQAAKPDGLLGRLLAWVMAHETAVENASALGALAVEPSDRILEVGFGHGYQIGELARDVLHVCGVDHSPEMLAFAARRLGPLLSAGRVDLFCGDARKLAFPDQHFDKALSVHTLYFWQDPLDYLAEVRRVLKPTGRLVLGYRPGEDKKTVAFPPSVYSFYERSEVEKLLLDAGFSDIRIRALTKSFHLALAVRPPTGVAKNAAPAGRTSVRPWPHRRTNPQNHS